MSSGFGNALRRLRRQKGISQQELARRTGLAVRTLGYWEAGQRLPCTPELEATLEALRLNSAERRALMTLLPTPRGIQRERLETSTVDTSLTTDLGDLPASGDLLRAMRIRRGWTQEQLAAGLGMTRFTITGWETTRHFPSSESLERLCDLLQAYPEERQALQHKGLATPLQAHDGSLEACAEATGVLLRQVHGFLTPLVDLQALALKRRLRLLAGQSEEALRLLAELEVEHSYWLMSHDRTPEAQAAIWRALKLVRGRFAPDRLWVNALNLASTFASQQSARRSSPNQAAFRLLKEWLPLLPQNHLRTILLCDMALYTTLDGSTDASYALLKEAQRCASLGEGFGESYLRLTSARIGVVIRRTPEDLERLLHLTTTPHQRFSYLLTGIDNLLAAGERRSASYYLRQAQADLTSDIPPRIQRRIMELSCRIS